MPNIHEYLKQQALKKVEKEKKQAGKEKKKFPKIRPYTILSPESQGFKGNPYNYTPPKNEIIETPKVEPQREISQSEKIQNDLNEFKSSEIQEAPKEKKKFPKSRPYTILSPESQGFKGNPYNYTPPKNEIIETPKVEPQREISQSYKLQNDNYVYKLSLINEALKQGILTIEEYYQKRKNLERELGLL